MRILKSISLTLLLLLWNKSNMLNAQVTFGDNSAPKSGVLLDLKQNDKSGANSNLGMLLPRVYVTGANLLNPMLDELKDYPTDTELKEKQEKIHIGLLVYNVNQCLLGGGEDQGIVVWNGTQWTSISKTTSKAVDVIENHDQEGNIFYSKNYGTQGSGTNRINAGEWMLSNLQVKGFDSQSDFANLEVPAPLTAPSTSHSNWKWAYPNKVGQNATDPTNYNFQESLGLLYNYYLANGLDALKVAQGDGQAAALRKGTQGLCPNGWHIPSDMEWNQMLEIVYNNPSLSSSVDRAQTWDHTKNSTPYSVAGLDDVLLAICYPVGSSDGVTSGKSFLSMLGGFNAILVGDAQTASGVTTNTDYGKSTTFWTASGNTTSNAWTRRINNNGTVDKLTLSSDSYFASIRCRKDDYIPFQTCGEEVQDAAGNIYTTAQFGSQCWINQNMRYIGGDITAADVAIPNGADGGTLNSSYGYLYTWNQATGGASSDVLMTDEIGDMNSKKIQGICPDGWHVPSDYEWGLLETSVGASEDDINTLGWRSIGTGAGGYKLLAKPSHQPNNAGSGISESNTDGGFAAYLSGYGLNTTTPDYGITGDYWTASKAFAPIGVDEYMRQRSFRASDNKVYRDSSRPETRMSVRCVLD